MDTKKCNRARILVQPIILCAWQMSHVNNNRIASVWQKPFSGLKSLPSNIDLSWFHPAVVPHCTSTSSSIMLRFLQDLQGISTNYDGLVCKIWRPRKQQIPASSHEQHAGFLSEPPGFYPHDSQSKIDLIAMAIALPTIDNFITPKEPKSTINTSHEEV